MKRTRLQSPECMRVDPVAYRIFLNSYFNNTMQTALVSYLVNDIRFKGIVNHTHTTVNIVRTQEFLEESLKKFLERSQKKNANIQKLRENFILEFFEFINRT